MPAAFAGAALSTSTCTSLATTVLSPLEPAQPIYTAEALGHRLSYGSPRPLALRRPPKDVLVRMLYITTTLVSAASAFSTYLQNDMNVKRGLQTVRWVALHVFRA